MISPALTRVLNGMLLAGAVVCLLIFLYFFHHYTLTGQREFGRPALMFLYYGGPLVAAGLVLAALRLRPEHRLNLILVVGSLSVALYLGESALGYISARRAEANETITAGRHTEARFERIARMAAREGVTFDTRFGFELVLELRAEGVHAVPPIFPADVMEEQPDGSRVSTITIHGSEVVPMGGISNAVTVFCNESGEYVIYTSDEHGFHNPPGMWDDEPPDVAAIGDSFTAGMCVPSHRSFVALIRDRHPRTLNLGVSGSGPLLQFAVLEEYLRPLEPRHVLWFFYEGNDHDDLIRESRSPLLLRYLTGDFRQGLRGRRQALDEALHEMVDRALEGALARREEPEESSWEPASLVRSLLRPVRLAHIRRGIGMLDAGPARGGPPPEDLRMDLFRDIVSRTAKAVGSWGGSLHFVYLPTRNRYALQREYPREEVLGVVREAGIPIIDVHEAFVAHGDPLGLFPFRRFGHYSEEGHRLVAETVLREAELGSAGADEAGT